MKHLAFLVLMLPLLTACETVNWPERDEDDLTAAEIGRSECRPATAADPVARGEWVCENPRTGEVRHQRDHPIYD